MSNLAFIIAIYFPSPGKNFAACTVPSLLQQRSRSQRHHWFHNNPEKLRRYSREMGQPHIHAGFFYSLYTCQKKIIFKKLLSAKGSFFFSRPIVHSVGLYCLPIASLWKYYASIPLWSFSRLPILKALIGGEPLVGWYPLKTFLILLDPWACVRLLFMQHAMRALVIFEEALKMICSAVFIYSRLLSR